MTRDVDRSRLRTPGRIAVATFLVAALSIPGCSDSPASKDSRVVPPAGGTLEPDKPITPNIKSSNPAPKAEPL